MYLWTFNNIDVFSYNLLKIDKSFYLNYEELSNSRKIIANNVC